MIKGKYISAHQARLKVLISVLIFFIVLNAQNVAQEQNSMLNIDKTLFFDKLIKNEVLSYEYTNGKLQIIKVLSNGKNEIISEWNNVRPGGYQISKDQRRILFSTYLSGYYRPSYLVDGDRGCIVFLFDAPNGYRTDEDIKYLIGTDWNANPGDEIDYNEVIDIRILIYNIDEAKLIDTLNWRLNNKLGSIEYLRSMNSVYDFKLVYNAENLMYAEAYYDVKNKIFNETFNITSNLIDAPSEFESSLEEKGFIKR